MVGGVQMMAMRDMGMMPTLFVRSLFVMASRLLVMMSRMLVMFSGLLVMSCAFMLGHFVSPFM